jgi:prevent-host-death family protein
MNTSITIKQLHGKTGQLVRRAATLRSPLVITDRGQPMAVLANPSLLRLRRRKRTILREYEALMAKTPVNDVLHDLDAIRGDR